MDGSARGDALTVRLAIRMYSGVARLLPERLYRDYGREIEADFGAMVRAEHERAGVAGALRILGAATMDVVSGAMRERWTERFVRRASLIRGVRAERVAWGDEMANWMQEMRQAARSLARRPGFTLTVVLTLALGIGANVAIFAIVNAVLIQPLPYPESDRLVWIRHHAPGLQLPELENSPGTLQLYEEHARSFAGLAAVRSGLRNMLSGGTEPSRTLVAEATPSLFDVMRVQPRVGRAFVEADADAGAAPVAVLTHRAWATHFGGSADVIGQTVRLNDVSTEIVGVMPESFAYPSVETAMLIPFRPDPLEGFGSFGIGGLARLGPGIELSDAQRELTALQARIPEMFPDVPAEMLERAGWSVSVATLRDVRVGDAATALWIVLGTVAFLLLVACASVANLFLVRAEARQREVGIRMALGAAPGRIAATYLYESVLVGLAGGAWGTVAALAAVRALVAAGPPQLPRLEEITVDLPVLLFAALISIGAGLLFGVLPLVRQMTQPLFGLVGASRGHTAGRERQRARKVLIVAQIALALVLLTGSGLMLRSFQQLRSVDPGFRADGLITVDMSLGESRSKEEASQITQLVLEQVRALAGVTGAGATNALPLDPNAGLNGGSFRIQSKPREEGALPPVAMYAVVTEGFHEAMGTALLEGRGITLGDEQNGRRVAVVNQTFARDFLDGRAIGEFISFGGEEETAWHEVVGVVGDVRAFGLREELRAIAYLPITTPITGARPTGMSVVARTAGDPVAMAPLIRAIVRRVAPDVPLMSARTMAGIRDDALADTTFTMMILSVAAVAALLLGAIGLYGVIGYVVSQRTREIGVRIALGAVPAGVRRMVLRQGLALAGLGALIGLAGAVALTRLLDAVLFQVGSRDPATFVVVTVVLLGVSALAAWVPARRASSVSPLEALRSE